MKIAIRADASLKMGSGHVMRCVTLANALREQGVEVWFLCRPHEGDFIDWLEQKGYVVVTLAKPTGETDKTLFHADWLGTTQSQDAEQCAGFLEENYVDWLIVDHYALDKTWESALKPYYQKLMVIDDLGDREHICDLLLDQNYGSTQEKYKDLVPGSCQVLVGPDYALLRPEFAQWREYSLQRRQIPKLKSLLITMGGVDPDNYTGKVIDQLVKANSARELEVTIVLGETAPHKESLESKVQMLPMKISIKSNVQNMGELMANADLSIGAAGSTSWERCALGLPSILLVIADNQKSVAQALANKGAIKALEQVQKLASLVDSAPCWMSGVSKYSSQLVDGNGCSKVVSNLMEML